MKRLWAPLLVLLVLCVPLAVSAQSGLPLFDPEWQLVPEANKLDSDCPVGSPLGFGGVLQLIQNGMNAAISFGIIICVLTIAGAGILWILTPTNPENHSQAKKILTNAVIGLLIILSAWLIVDFVMKLLYDSDRTEFGPWNTILSGGDYCVVVKEGNKPLFSGSITSMPGVGTGTGGGGADSGPTYTTAGSCSPNSVKAAAATGGVTMSIGEARFFACVSRPESTCGTKLQNYNWGKGSSAYGPFQILLDGNSRCFNNAVCSAAAGVTGNLNCDTGFRNGNPIAGSAVANNCKKAAANLACSTVAAHCVFRAQGHRAWTGNRDSTPKHQQCIRELTRQ